jgi:hypothetical protein
MDTIICDIPVVFNLDQVAKVAGVRPGLGYDLLAETELLFLQYARPKAVIKWVDIQAGENGTVFIDNTPFKSVIVSEKLKSLEKAIVFVATAGTELEAIPEIEESILLKESLLMYSLMLAHGYVVEFVTENFGYKEPGYLNPGSLPDWPIENNFALFDILGPATEQIDVQIMESGYMRPWKTSSGIIFSDAGGYQNCILCKNLDCIGRRAPFDEVEYNRIFA